MKKIKWVSAEELFSEAAKKINQVNLILDVGCGIRPQVLTSTFVHICIDAHKQYLDVLRRRVKNEMKIKGTLKYLFLQKTIEDIISDFPGKIVDSIFLLDVIEHLDKSTGIKLIDAFNKIARHQIVIFTPLGFVSQEHPDGKDAWGLDGGKWQEHKSGWTPDDFDDSWEFIVCKDFHSTSNMGQIHEVPVGAFFAIKAVGPQPSLIAKRTLMSKMLFWIKSFATYQVLKYS